MEKIQLSEKWIVTLLLFKDLLIHVRDVSHPETENQKMNVLNVLKNLEVPDRLMSSIIEVHNKTDLIQEYGENAPTQYCAKVLGMCRICWNINKIYVYFVSRCTHVFVCVYIYKYIFYILFKNIQISNFFQTFSAVNPWIWTCVSDCSGFSLIPFLCSVISALTPQHFLSLLCGGVAWRHWRRRWRLRWWIWRKVAGWIFPWISALHS